MCMVVFTAVPRPADDEDGAVGVLEVEAVLLEVTSSSAYLDLPHRIKLIAFSSTTLTVQAGSTC